MKTVSALKHRGFLFFWLGQMVSLIGTWMQNMAQGWLVLDLTHSAFLLGVVSAAQFTPMLLLSPFAGVISDRVDKRRMLLFTQGSLMLCAAILGLLTLTHHILYWQVLLIAFLSGTASCFDTPTRQSFVIEMVGRKDLMNAVALNSAVFNSARIIGPAVAGLVIAGVGVGMCFIINAFSFLAVLTVLATIRSQFTLKKTDGQKGTIREEMLEGLQYIRTNPVILDPIIMMGTVSLFAINFQVLVPSLARLTLHQGAQGYGLLMTATGIGALVGALTMATFSEQGPKKRVLLGAAVGLCIFQIALVPAQSSFLASALLLGLAGWAMITFSTSVNSTLQLEARDRLRGRVMSIYSLVFAGVTPLGSLFSGTVAHLAGAPIAFAAGGGSALICIGALLAVRRRLSARPHANIPE